MIRKIAKALRLKQLTSFINFSSTIKLNNKSFVIPVVRNMGLMNLSVKSDWLSTLFKKLNLQPGSSFVDIGVNVGQTMLCFRSCYNNAYWGFEPNPACIFYLNLLSKANGFRNVNIIPVGLSSSTAIAKFYSKNLVDSAGTTIDALRPGVYNSDDVNYIPLFAFDQLKLDGLENIALIKIDVEGGELEVLQGMTETIQKYKPFIVCEVLDYHTELSRDIMQGRADKLFSYMKQLQYDIYRIDHAGNSLAFEKMEAIQLKKWTNQSIDLNDYLFVPSGIALT